MQRDLVVVVDEQWTLLGRRRQQQQRESPILQPLILTTANDENQWSQMIHRHILSIALDHKQGARCALSPCL
jgi:hypothetical protein